MNREANQELRIHKRLIDSRVVETLKKWKWWMYLLIVAGGFVIYWDYWRNRVENSQDERILNAARRYNMDPALIKAVVWRESRFNPNARGKVGEIGLMQIGKLAAGEWAESEKITNFQHEQLFDPTLNTLAGTWYLRKVMGRYTNTDNPLPFALADYNAGRTHVLRWNKDTARTNSAAFLDHIDYPTTRAYIQTILKRYQRYKKQYWPEAR